MFSCTMTSVPALVMSNKWLLQLRCSIFSNQNYAILILLLVSQCLQGLHTILRIPISSPECFFWTRICMLASSCAQVVPYLFTYLCMHAYTHTYIYLRVIGFSDIISSSCGPSLYRNYDIYAYQNHKTLVP